MRLLVFSHSQGHGEPAGPPSAHVGFTAVFPPLAYLKQSRKMKKTDKTEVLENCRSYFLMCHPRKYSRSHSTTPDRSQCKFKIIFFQIHICYIKHEILQFVVILVLHLAII